MKKKSAMLCSLSAETGEKRGIITSLTGYIKKKHTALPKTRAQKKERSRKPFKKEIGLS